MIEALVLVYLTVVVCCEVYVFNDWWTHRNTRSIGYNLWPDCALAVVWLPLIVLSPIIIRINRKRDERKWRNDAV